MKERRPNGSNLAMGSARSRRKVLKGMLTVVAGGLGAMGTHPQNAGAARRGYSSPQYSGFTIVALESWPNRGLETEIFPSRGRGLTIVNAHSGDIEVEVVPPLSGTVRVQLTSGESLWMPIDHAGKVYWRVWLPGQQPGDYHVIDVPS